MGFPVKRNQDLIILLSDSFPEKLFNNSPLFNFSIAFCNNPTSCIAALSPDLLIF